MSTEGTNAPVVAAKTIVAAEETSEQQNPQRVGEGLGVFRALLLTVAFYFAFGVLAWVAWLAFKHWRGH